MEISKPQKFDINSIRVGRRTDVISRVAALDVGQMIQVSGVDRSSLGYAAGLLKKEGRAIRVQKIALNIFNVYRLK